MIVAYSVREIGYEADTIVTVGTFDGVHAGHRSIIAEVTRRAKSGSFRSVVVTFDPHPRSIVGRGPVQLLATLPERLAIMSDLGIDGALVVEFSYAFSRLTPREFYEQYLLHGTGVREVIIGYDHMFGRDRGGGTKELEQFGREFGFATTIVGPVTIDGDTVNSSKIRELLLDGDVERAGMFLQRPYELAGTVVHGDGRGATIGFPTANVDVDEKGKLVPANGVYLVSVDCDGRRFFGMMNIGIRPTFDSGSRRIIEVHLLEFTGDLYGKRLRLQFLKRLRAERKFESVEELTRQLESDRNESVKYLSALY